MFTGPKAVNEVNSDEGVILMVKSDIFTGLLVGIVIGLMFTTTLAPHLPVILVLALVYGAKIINLK